MKRRDGGITILDSIAVDEIRIFFHPAERETATLTADACGKTVGLVREGWGLEPPKYCRLYMMKSMPEFVFGSAPFSWRLLLALTLPFWYFRARKAWRSSAGWTLRYGSKVAVGVKPPEVLARSDRRTGARVFVEERDIAAVVGRTACHELVHACAARLRLPSWLNEGIAMVTVDRFAGIPTVRDDTLSFLAGPEDGKQPATYGEFSRLEEETTIRRFVRGYWIVRYLEETSPGLIRNLFEERRNPREMIREICIVLGLKRGDFRREIDTLVVRHYSDRNRTRKGGES